MVCEEVKCICRCLCFRQSRIINELDKGINSLEITIQELSSMFHRTFYCYNLMPIYSYTIKCRKYDCSKRLMPVTYYSDCPTDYCPTCLKEYLREMIELNRNTIIECLNRTLNVRSNIYIVMEQLKNLKVPDRNVTASSNGRYCCLLECFTPPREEVIIDFFLHYFFFRITCTQKKRYII